MYLYTVFIRIQNSNSLKIVLKTFRFIKSFFTFLRIKIFLKETLSKKQKLKYSKNHNG